MTRGADPEPPGTASAEPDASAGADSEGPGQIPARGWWRILRRVARRIGAERFTMHGAAVAFFAVLSVAPVLLTALSVYGAINTPAQAQEQPGSWILCRRRWATFWPTSSSRSPQSRPRS